MKEVSITLSNGDLLMLDREGSDVTVSLETANGALLKLSPFSAEDCLKVSAGLSGMAVTGEKVHRKTGFFEFLRLPASSEEKE